MVRSIFMHIIASVLGHWFLIIIHLELGCGNVLCCETFEVDIKMLVKHYINLGQSGCPLHWHC